MSQPEQNQTPRPERPKRDDLEAEYLTAVTVAFRSLSWCRLNGPICRAKLAELGTKPEFRAVVAAVVRELGRPLLDQQKILEDARMTPGPDDATSQPVGVRRTPL